MGAMTNAITTVKDDIQLREWSRQVQECSGSGLSVVQWCSMNGIPASTYYNRLRRLRETALEDIGCGTIAADAGQSVVRIEAASRVTEKIDIICGKLQIAVPADINAQTLTAMLTVLKNA